MPAPASIPARVSRLVRWIRSHGFEAVPTFLGSPDRWTLDVCIPYTTASGETFEEWHSIAPDARAARAVLGY